MINHDVAELIRIEKTVERSPWTEHQFLQTIKNVSCDCDVYTNFQKIVGYSVYSKITNHFHLQKICVHPEYQRQKIGTKLLNSIVKKCVPGEKIQLEVRAGNKSAIQFYTINGFTEDIQRKKLYSTPQEDGILMTKIVN